MWFGSRWDSGIVMFFRCFPQSGDASMSCALTLGTARCVADHSLSSNHSTDVVCWAHSGTAWSTDSHPFMTFFVPLLPYFLPFLRCIQLFLSIFSLFSPFTFSFIFFSAVLYSLFVFHPFFPPVPTFPFVLFVSIGVFGSCSVSCNLTTCFFGALKYHQSYCTPPSHPPPP